MNGKRILSFILALVMVLGMVPFNALDVFAAGDATSNTTPLVVDMLNGSISSGDLYNVLKGSSVFNAEPASGVAKEYGWTGSGVGLMNFPWGGDFRYGTEEYAVQGTELTSTSSGNANVESGVMYNAWRRSGKGQGTSGLYVGEYAGPKYFVPVACYDIKLNFASDMGSITINDVTVAGTTIKGGTYTYADHDGETVRIYAGQTVTANSVADGEVNYTPSVATYTPSTSETLTITYSQDQGSITVNNFTHGSLDKNIAGKYAAGTKVTFTATPEAVNGGVGYYVSSITVDGTEQISNPDKSMRSFEVTVTVQKDTEHKVIVTFGKLELSGNATANVEFNPAKSAADQLDALKQEIFNKLMVSYVPDGVTYDQIKYEHKYFQTYTLAGQLPSTSRSDNYVEIGQTAAPYDGWQGIGVYTPHPFGYTGLGAVEHVKLTYNGLSIEADVTLEWYYNITWKDSDGTVLETDRVLYNTIPTYDNKGGTFAELAAAKNDAQYTYDWDGWDKDIVAANGDLTYTATYSTSTNTYTVTWEDADGTVLETDEHVPYGTTPSYDNVNSLGTTAELADKLDDKQYDYSFAGWDPLVNAVTDNVTYTATYTRETKEYTIKFVDNDGTVLQEGKVKYGETPVFSDKAPTKAADAQYTYTWSGKWDNEIKAVDGAMTYTAIDATFNTTVNTYTVIWKDHDGDVLETDENVPYGQMPEYNGNAPEKAPDGENVYYFDGWTPEVDAVTGNVEYTAKFTTVSKIKVTFSVLGDTSRYTNVVPGEKVSAYAAPSISGWQFSGWYADEACTTEFDFENTVINAATTIYAKMTKLHTVTFNTNGGTPVVENQIVLDGNKATVPSVNPDKEQETFIGWYLGEDLYDFNTVVTGDVTLIAKYGTDVDNDEKVDGSVEDPYLTYVWKDSDGTELYSATILSGAQTPSYTISDSDTNGKYFTGWSEVVDGNTTTYTANWVDDENNNDVDDETETGTVTVVIEGEGNVTLTPAGNASLVGQNGNVYTYLYDSTDDANKVINVSTSLIDTDGTDGNVDYLISSPASVTVVAQDTVEVNVQFGTHELNANNPTITLNGYDETTMKVSREAFKAAILEKAGLPANGNYKIEVQVRDDFLDIDAYTEILGEKVYYNYPVIQGAISVPESGRQIKITDNTTGVSKTVSLTVKDSRNPAQFGELTNTDFGELNDLDAFKDALKTAIKQLVKDGNGNPISDPSIILSDYVEVSKDVSTGRTVYTYNVKASIVGGATWQGAEKVYEGLTWTVNQYEITWVDGNNNVLYSEMLDYDATPSFNPEKNEIAEGENPTKTATAQYTYTFNNTWSPAVSAVTGAVTYTAQFDATVNKYTVTWIWVNKGGETITITQTEVPYGTVPTFDEVNNEKPTKAPTTVDGVTTEWTWNGGWTAVENVDPEGKFITGNAVYNPTFIEAKGHKVTFMNGTTTVVVKFVNTDEGETTVDSLPTLDDPKNDNLTFTGWFVGETQFTKDTEVTGDIVVTANWETDENNNNVDDDQEKATVTVTIEGAGSVTLTPAGNATELSQNGNVYTFLFDSTDDSSKVINVTATPNDQIASDGSMGYVVSAPKTVTLASGQNATVEAKFDVRTLTVTSGTIAVNKYYTENSDVKALEGLRDKILIEAGLDPNGSYTVTTTVSGVQAVVKITNDGAFYTLAGNNVDVSQLFVLALDNDANRTFIITQAADGILPEVSTSVTMGITDSRTPTTVAHTATKPYTAGTLATPVLEDIRANLVVNPGVENSGITIVDVVWDSANPEGTELEEGKLYDNIKIIVKVTENENFCGTEIPVTVAVQAPYIKATITIDEKANIEFNNSMTDEDKTEAVLAVVNPVHTPALPDGVSATVWYLASEARNVDYTINLAQLDLGAFGNMLVGNVLPEIYTVQIPVEEMWLNIGDDLTIPDAPSNERLSEILSNLLSKYAASYLAGEMSDDDLKDILKRTLAENPDIAEYYKYLGAHKFAENEKVDTNGNILEYVYLSVSDYGFGAAKSDVCELTLADTRIESEIKLNTGVEVTYNNYTEEELLALILDGVYANGQKIGGLTVEFVTDVEGLPASDASEVTVKFAGNKDYKPATATVAIKINKAPVTVSVDNRLYKWHDGFTYSLSDVIRTNPAGVDTINFVAGLDVHEVNLNGGLKGFVAKVQLMLPEDLQSLLASADALLQSAGLNVSFADGASMKLSELLAAVDALDHLFAGTEYEEYFRVLLNMLQSLPTDVADIEIVIGGALPTDIGVYVVGAISADANYTTDFGVGAVVIYPDGTKVDLAWNQNDDNYIITNTLLTTKGADGKYLFDAGATAFVRDTNYTEVDPTATEQVAEIFLGVDIDGNITVEMDQTKLNVGAYIEVAMAVEWGNEMYYSVPIVRPIVVVAETLNVDFRDDNGNVNNERHFEFFNVAQDAMEKNLLVTYKKDGNGYKAGDEVTDYSVKFFYVGVQTNGKPYASTQAPVHAGVYTITAVVTLRDASGAITHAGQGIGALVIEPSKSTIDVENEAIKWDGNEHNFNQYVHADSVNTDLIPDTTVITVGISADLNANIGLDAIEGTFNVDLPAWMDELMKKLGILEAGYTDTGITVAQFKSYVQKLEEAMAELGVDSAAFDKVIDVIGQMSDKATLTFHDDKGYTDIGAYLVIGIVTDSDHWPSADAGIVVIYPDGEKAELKYAETWDDNNVFTWNVLQHYDLNAEAYLKGEFSQDLTDKTLNLFVGFADHGELILTKNKAELDNGVYAEVSFLLILDNTMYYAEPITREVIIVPNPADVDFLDDAGNVNNDRHFQFTNQAHAMGKIQVVLADGTKLVLDSGDDRLDILYVGVQLNGKPYASAEAPVHAGVYEVTAQYTERKDGKVYNLGIGIGMLVIEPSKSETVVDNGAYPYGETHHVNDLVHVSSVNVPSLTPDATVISAGLSTDLDTISGLSSINGTVNVDLPAWMDDILNKLNILDAGYADGISRETFLSYVEKIENGMKELGVETDAFAEITNVINQLPVNTNLTFQDNIGYSEIGAYLIIAVVTDSDHYPSVGAGVMVIYPDATKAELRFEEDWNGNNIFTWSALQSMNLEAMAYVNGVESVEASQYVTNLYVGFTSDGTVMLKAVSYGERVKDLPEFKNGVYSQIAVLLDLGNQLYYAEPISRAFMIVPTPANIEFVGENVFTFDNQPHALDVKVTINGVEITDLSGLELHYTGIMTNGKAYASNEAPAHAGVYVVTASYTVRDEHDRLVTLGVAVGSLVIKPAKAEIDVANRADVYVENETHDTASMITVSSDVNTIIDKTVITVGLKTDGTFSENGLSAIDGDINVDLPKWLDDVLSNYNIFANGLSVAEFKDAVASVKAELAELGISTEILDRLVNVVEQFPATATLTFHDQADMAPTTVGAYLVIGVVTDANFYPAMDAGLLVIYPDVQKTNLSWIYEDVNNNNIYTKDTLETIDLGAKADADISDLIVNLFIGVDAENWKITLENNQAELNIGVYEEFSFVKPNVNSVIYYAEPISRPVIVVANFYNVSIHDKVVTEMFDNTAKDMGEITVTTMDGAPVDITKGTLTVTYVGIDTMLRPYYSTEKPVHAGTYTVIATYVGNDDDGDLSFGAGIGQLIIQRAAVDVQVESHALIYGQPYDFRIDTFHNAVNDEPKVLTILAGVDLSAYTTEGKLGIDGTVNVDFPEPIDAVLSELFPDLYVNGIGTDAFFTKYDEMVAAIEERGYSADLLKQLKTMLSKLNAVNLTFNDAVKPTETGLYAVIAMTFDPDYQHAVDTALIAIAPDAVVGELDFVADMPQVLNAEVLPFDMLDSFDFRAYVSALKSASGNLNAEDIAVKDVIFGLTTDLELFLGSSQEKPNAMGVYDQIAYAPLTENNLMAILPIHRDFLVTDSTANVVYVDPNGNVNWLREFTYGETVDMGAKIMLSDGTILDVTPNVTYVGIENGVEFYRSSEVPTDAGLYTVFGYYMDADENIYTIGLAELLIKPKEVTITVADETMTFGDALPTLTYTVNGLVDGDSLAVNVSTEADGTMVGTYDITATYTADPNYKVTVVNGKLTIEKKTITAADVVLNGTLIYSGTEQTQQITVTNGVTYTVSGNTATNAGEYTLTVTGTGNYTGTVDVKWTVAAKEVTITVADETITAGETPKLNYTVDGLVNGDDLNVIVTVDGDYSVSGTYDITATYTADPNYDVTVVKGKLTVEAQREVKWAASAQFGNTLSLAIGFHISDIGEAEGYYAVLTRSYSDGRADHVVTVNREDWISQNHGGKAYYFVVYNGIAAKEMIDGITVVVYDAEGNPVAAPYTESVRSYAMRALSKHSVKNASSTLYVDLLNYGAAAQDYFNYAEDNMANRELSNEQKAFATAQNISCDNNLVADGNFVGAALQMKSAIRFALVFRNVENATHAVVSFTNHKGDSIQVVVDAANFIQNGTAVVVEDIRPADCYDLITVTVYNGNVVLAEAVDSLESYVARAENIHDVYQAFMKYANSALEYYKASK